MWPSARWENLKGLIKVHTRKSQQYTDVVDHSAKLEA